MKKRATLSHAVILGVAFVSITTSGYIYMKNDVKKMESKRHHTSQLSSVTVSDKIVGASINEAFEMAQSKLSNKDMQLINLVADDKNIGDDAEGLLDKVTGIYLDLKPEADLVQRQLDEVRLALTERTYNINLGVSQDNDRIGSLTLPLVEGLLADYGATDHVGGILVSAEKDEYGSLPIVSGVSYKEAPILLSEFTRLRASGKGEYNKVTELAHASFLRNWLKFGCNWSPNKQCAKPDPKTLEANELWFKTVKREVVDLRAKKKALESLNSLAVKLETVEKKLSSKMVQTTDSQNSVGS